MRCLVLSFVLALFAPGAANPADAAGSAAAAAAPNLFKCVSTRGDVSFQAAPCAAGARLIWARTVVPEPALATPRQAAPARAVRPASESARVTGGSRRPARAAPLSGCEAAKARRADLRDRQWRTIRFDQLRSLDEEVARACSRR